VHAQPTSRRRLLTRIVTGVLGLALWFCPVPAGVTPPAWHLFAIFATAILSVVFGALPILTASVFAVGLAVLTRTLTPQQAYAGFAHPTILLIVMAFLVARAVVKCGLGQRLGHLVVSRFGRSTLGIAYSVFAVDALIAPAFPSSTARSGVIYPLVEGLAEATGARPGDPARRRLGSFLMFSGMTSISLSSALWFTAMAANPLGAAIARQAGLRIEFGSWLLASCVPTLATIVVMPLVLYRLIRPEVTATPEAPAAARAALAKLGPLTRDERIVTATFAGMVVLWGLAGTLSLDSTSIALMGLGVLLVTRVLTLEDLSKEGDVLVTFIWFASLYSLSAQLNEMGFMGYLGERLAGVLHGVPWPVAYVALVVAYVVLHYLFVSQTAHLLALFGVFLGVGIRLGVPGAPLAFQLLFASNTYSVITPQGSSANLLFTGSGYLSQGELYKLGAAAVATSVLVFLLVGTPWLLWVAR
jgi:DASS family divalent anion:Na+ symporter